MPRGSAQLTSGAMELFGQSGSTPDRSPEKRSREWGGDVDASCRPTSQSVLETWFNGLGACLSVGERRKRKFARTRIEQGSSRYKRKRSLSEGWAGKCRTLGSCIGFILAPAFSPLDATSDKRVRGCPLVAKGDTFVGVLHQLNGAPPSFSTPLLKPAGMRGASTR